MTTKEFLETHCVEVTADNIDSLSRIRPICFDFDKHSMGYTSYFWILDDTGTYYYGNVFDNAPTFLSFFRFCPEVVLEMEHPWPHIGKFNLDFDCWKSFADEDDNDNCWNYSDISTTDDWNSAFARLDFIAMIETLYHYPNMREDLNRHYLEDYGVESEEIEESQELIGLPIDYILLADSQLEETKRIRALSDIDEDRLKRGIAKIESRIKEIVRQLKTVVGNYSIPPKVDSAVDSILGHYNETRTHQLNAECSRYDYYKDNRYKYCLNNRALVADWIAVGEVQAICYFSLDKILRNIDAGNNPKDIKNLSCIQFITSDGKAFEYRQVGKRHELAIHCHVDSEGNVFEYNIDPFNIINTIIDKWNLSPAFHYLNFTPEIYKEILFGDEDTDWPNFYYWANHVEQLFEMLLKRPLFELVHKHWGTEKFLWLIEKYKYINENELDEEQRNLDIALRIAIRHGYKFKDVYLWKDMIDLLGKAEMDVHNPKYVCPENLPAMHAEALDRAQRVRKNQWEKYQREFGISIH